MRIKILLMCAASTMLAMWLQGCMAVAADAIPPQIETQLPATAATFDPAGLCFTNVNYKIGLGTEMETGTGGTLTYAQGDADLFHFKSFDLGVGTETTFSAGGSGLHSAAVAFEGIKNLSNWQLVGKAGYGRDFEDQVGNYAKFGFDVNYNLTRGTGLTFLGSSGGSFTYAGAGVSYAIKNLSLAQANSSTKKSFRIYVGYAF